MSKRVITFIIPNNKVTLYPPFCIKKKTKTRTMVTKSPFINLLVIFYSTTNYPSILLWPVPQNIVQVNGNVPTLSATNSISTTFPTSKSSLISKAGILIPCATSILSK